MSRIKRIAVITPAVLLLIFIVQNWGLSLRDYSPTPAVLMLLLALLLLNYLLPFTAPELIGLLIITTPAMYFTFHALCGLTVLESYLLVIRCALALCFCFLIFSIIETYKPRPAASIPRLLAALAVAFLWTFVLLRQNILFSLSLTVVVGLLLLYRRSLKKDG